MKIEEFYEKYMLWIPANLEKEFYQDLNKLRIYYSQRGERSAIECPRGEDG